MKVITSSLQQVIIRCRYSRTGVPKAPVWGPVLVHRSDHCSRRQVCKRSISCRLRQPAQLVSLICDVISGTGCGVSSLTLRFKDVWLLHAHAHTQAHALLSAASSLSGISRGKFYKLQKIKVRTKPHHTIVKGLQFNLGSLKSSTWL